MPPLNMKPSRGQQVVESAVDAANRMTQEFIQATTFAPAATASTPTPKEGERVTAAEGRKRQGEGGGFAIYE